VISTVDIHMRALERHTRWERDFAHAGDRESAIDAHLDALAIAAELAVTDERPDSTNYSSFEGKSGPQANRPNLHKDPNDCRRTRCPRCLPMSLIDRNKSLVPARRVARAARRWRYAAHLVWTRWEVFLGAEPEARAFAFASYTAALDAEETAAAAMARLFHTDPR
jgi:hypothetical protein